MNSNLPGDTLRGRLIALNVFSLLLYSPNFISVVYPALKGLQLAVFLVTAWYLLATASPRIDKMTALLLLFLILLVSSAAINYVRFTNAESLYLALSYIVKALCVVMLFQLCRTSIELDRMLKLCAVMLVGYAAHGIVQFIAVALGLVAAQGSVEVLGYEFVDLGWAGIYRVAFPLAGFDLIRIQSFFQEPGFFAFYLLVGLVLLDWSSARMRFRHSRLCKGIVIVAMLLTLSLTGIGLMLAYLVVTRRSWVFRGTTVVVGMAAIDFIVSNESEFIAKAGSLDLRLEHFSLLETVASSWENVVFGIGFGNEGLISEMRVNNFVAELLMYSSVFGLIVMLAMLVLAMKRGRETNHIVLLVLVYALSTPMLWSPLFLLAVFLSWHVPRAAALPSGRRVFPVG